MRAALAIASSFLLVCWSAAAGADAIDPAPTNCPNGAKGESSHDGAFCVPKTCGKDADCRSGEVCDDVPLCEEEQKYTPVGWGGTPNGPETTRVVVNAACKPGETCVRGTCKSGKRCVPAMTRMRSKCGCEAPGAPAGGGALLLALCAAAVIARRAISPRS